MGEEDSTAEGEHERSFAGVLFLALIIENIVLDFGRPTANGLIPSPLDVPGVGDLFHIAYNLITPFLLLKLLERSSHVVSNNVRYAVVVVFTVGASMHLVGDSVDTRSSLYAIYTLDEPVFALLYIYDEYLGHYLWYLAYFFSFVMFFTGTFIRVDESDEPALTRRWKALAILGGLYFLYTVTEGQVWPLFMAYLALGTWLFVRARRREQVLNPNGQFVVWMFGTTFLLLVAWAVTLRGVPEFWPVFFDVVE